MKTIFKIFLILTTLITISCDNMYNDLAVEIDEYNFFLAVTQGATSGPTQIYSLGNSGLVENQKSNQFYSGATPGSIAIHPTGNFLYVSYTNRLYIDVYKINSNGSLLLIQSAGALANNPSTIKVHPTGKNLYCSISSNSTLAVFIVNENGTLTSLGTPVSTINSGYGNTPTKIAISPYGNYLYATSSNALVGYIINTNGSLPSIPTYEFHGTYNDGSSDYNIQFNNLNLIVDLAGRLYTIGLDSGRAMSYLYLLGFNYSLTLLDINISSDQGVGFGTWISKGSIAIHPSGNILYLGFHQSTGFIGNKYYAYKINQNGTVELLGSNKSFIGKADVSGMIINPINNYLYTSNNTDNEIAVLGINTDGSLIGLTQTITGISNASNLALIRKRK